MKKNIFSNTSLKYENKLWKSTEKNHEKSEDKTNSTSKQTGEISEGCGFENTSVPRSKFPHKTLGSRSSNQAAIWWKVSRNISSKKKLNGFNCDQVEKKI